MRSRMCSVVRTRCSQRSSMMRRSRSVSRAASCANAFAQLAARLPDRDRRIIELLWEHRVLTTEHIRDLMFGHHGHVRRRLVTLHRLGVLDRFRPLQATGSAPFPYVLGPSGAAVLAAERGIELRELGYRRDKPLAIAHNPRLGHIVGVNGFFAALAAVAHEVVPGSVELEVGVLRPARD